MEKEIYHVKKQLNHVAFIMDGNGRWANKKGLPRHLGHKAACERLCDIFDECIEQKIKVVSLYAFSTENWNRPQDEIDHLFEYLELFFKRKKAKLLRDGSKVIISGDVKRLPKRTQEVIEDICEASKDNEVIVINICLNYGGKDEILKATKEIATLVKNGMISEDDINENLFEDHLYTRGLPNVDLLIRTSGESRTSNFLPWQLAYAEFIFTETFWPDFTPAKLRDCLKIYDTRNRRFGGLKNE